MNTIWSKHIQGIYTLYYSRKLRFHDVFSQEYKALFQLEEGKKLKILEIGCGPGALAEALHHWYPNAEITAIDRDSAFIEFAKANTQGIEFIEGDATKLPFSDNTFDVTISHTVSEHIAPSLFYEEQRRVLKDGGICLVLSSRKGISHTSPLLEESEVEKRFWAKAHTLENLMEKYSIGQYALNEMELPITMERFHFHNVSTNYITLNLTPDSPTTPSTMARDIINANRYNDLEAVDAVYNTSPEQFSLEEVSEMKKLIHEKYDRRLHDYECGIKHWDMSLPLLMIIRGTK